MQGTHLHLRLLSIVLLAGLSLFSLSGWGQTQPGGCKQSKQTLVCDQASFQKTFAAAKTASVVTDPANRMAAGQVTKAIEALGKTVQASGGTSDVTFLISRASREGLTIGPAGAELATLRIYAGKPMVDASSQGLRGQLIWSETYTGQPDMSWPAIVHALLEQFQSELVGKP